jgi:hypothetical protein
VGMIECLADVRPDLGNFTIAQQFPVDQVTDGVSLDQFTDQVRPSPLRPEFMVCELVKGDDAGVAEPGRRLGFSLDPRPRLGLGIDHFDRYIPFESIVPRPVNRAATARAEAVANLESVQYNGPGHPPVRFGAQLRDPPRNAKHGALQQLSGGRE